MAMGAIGAAGALAGTVGDMLGLTKNQKAVLHVVEGDPVGGEKKLKVMFNPASYSITIDQVVVETVTGSKSHARQEYRGTNAMTIAFDLFFDEYSKPAGDVTKSISTLFDWMRPTKKTQKSKKPEPPKVAFEWGGNKQLDGFRGFLTSCTVNYTVFRMDGTPVRADVKVTLKGSAPDPAGGNPTSRASGSQRVHSVIDGDTLQSIAFSELGKATYWRAIADLNDIDDPLRLAPGRALLIPSLADAARGA
jgi:hypothetical protein